MLAQKSSEGVCFYANEGYLPHFEIALSTFRKHNPDTPVTLISIDCEPTYETVDVKSISSSMLIGGRINSVKSMLFDLTDYDIICHYDCDFVFRRYVNISNNHFVCMVRGHSRGPQLHQDKYHRIFKTLEKAYRENIGAINDFPLSQKQCVMYNAGFFIANRRDHSGLFNDWQKLMAVETPEHEPNSNVIDQYIINYLVHAKEMLEPLSLWFNLHFTRHSPYAIAVHFAGNPQAHLESVTNQEWPNDT